MTLWVALNDENVVRRYGIRNTHYGSFSEQQRDGESDPPTLRKSVVTLRCGSSPDQDLPGNCLWSHFVT